ncbi:cytochrome ubiquinol oxidase subunit II [Sedimentitalea todarodis]|uniref:Cytochrome ubiquinol oxidase subunit II n=1 Tax=Sedimentitalea todarodis TaxID=1631240 RepID=A0ABU3VEI5_9RHOB|nr:cytochrome ubiquinol oxidase subunit II [Sedimentitalea todarodis]MDU9004584.1 cytochrome ubiquinol oxidase subunit II [Sedimentitalea todarodis]
MSHSLIRRAPAFALASAGLAIAPDAVWANSSSFFDPQGPIAAAEKDHFIQTAAITMIAVLPVLLFVPLILWRYRYGNQKARYTPKWEFSALLDTAMWGVPFAIVAVLSVQLWQETVALDPYRPLKSDQPALEVQVIGLDWKWLFVYPEQEIATVGEMAFPADRPVKLTLTSDTVMQSFLISALAGQIYVMPGMETQLQVLADAPGEFEGENTQFNGDGFTQQKFRAVAQTDADFAAWSERVKSDGVPLDLDTYGNLAVRSTPTEVHKTLATSGMPADAVWFGTVLPDLFDRVLHRYHQGSALDPSGQPGSYICGPGALSQSLPEITR